MFVVCSMLVWKHGLYGSMAAEAASYCMKPPLLLRLKLNRSVLHVLYVLYVLF